MEDGRFAQQGGPWGPSGSNPGAPAGGSGWAPTPPGVPPGGGRGPKPITGSPETMALHALTIDPKTGLPRGEKPPASTVSVVAFVCGILLCLGPITGTSAIIAGVLGRRAARARPYEVGGAGLALAGIILGVLNLVLVTLGLVYLLLSQ
jgi:hypothetical protein